VAQVFTSDLVNICNGDFFQFNELNSAYKPTRSVIVAKLCGSDSIPDGVTEGFQ
jgi:hypothetical protein